jgi:hypothetical protein
MTWRHPCASGAFVIAKWPAVLLRSGPSWLLWPRLARRRGGFSGDMDHQLGVAQRGWLGDLKPFAVLAGCLFNLLGERDHEALAVGFGHGPVEGDRPSRVFC